MATPIDLSPLVTVMESGGIKIASCLTIGVVVYIAVFLAIRKKVDRRLADLVGRAAMGLVAISAMYFAFTAH
ncbi:hypothetical protein [Caballeronia novacaledonica]|uniref:Uncharacterized protein n=1 Tax=Caballeronia novacaledonica TaxID=1544861 RepID=A0AA37MHZ7_9BURK|nr:hypothetical protein [Caballeronia novacaledonica]GJH26908.1 hypothetical protein CBA19CS42_20350 [Caballeronia novacaledonica]